MQSFKKVHVPNLWVHNACLNWVIPTINIPRVDQCPRCHWSMLDAYKYKISKIVNNCLFHAGLYFGGEQQELLQNRWWVPPPCLKALAQTGGVGDKWTEADHRGWRERVLNPWRLVLQNFLLFTPETPVWKWVSFWTPVNGLFMNLPPDGLPVYDLGLLCCSPKNYLFLTYFVMKWTLLWRNM